MSVSKRVRLFFQAPFLTKVLIESGMEIPKSPIIFSKFQTSVVGSEEPILLPAGSTQVDYEAELAVVIGRQAKDVKAEDAMNYVFGYTNFNDVSARDFQFTDGQWQRGKSCDTFAPMGPFIATKAYSVPAQWRDNAGLHHC